MTAGRGVVHSERRPKELQDKIHQPWLQLWAALPAKDEEVAFLHRLRRAFRFGEEDGVTARVLIGSAFGFSLSCPYLAAYPIPGYQNRPGHALTLAAKQGERATPGQR